MTFSIAARCSRTGMFGIAIASSSPAVGARCVHLKVGLGAVASQNVTDPRLGPKALALMASGLGAAATLERLRETEPHIEHRQLALVDADGSPAAFSGTGTLGVHATAVGAARSGMVAAGNLLADARVPQAILDAFARGGGHLAPRLLGALGAGLQAGGEAGPVHSAALVVVGEVPWPIVDLRVDWDDNDPIGRLDALWRLYEPQLEAYVRRALDPGEAPSYGVPGDP